MNEWFKQLYMTIFRFRSDSSGYRQRAFLVTVCQVWS